jgi:hypothetical protein
MVDLPVVDQARAVVARHEAIQRLEHKRSGAR